SGKRPPEHGGNGDRGPPIATGRAIVSAREGNDMGRIESAREAVLQWSRAVLALRGRSLEGPFASDSPDGIDAIIGDTRLVMTPAQTAGFFARSSSWRCTGCGKVHVFA